MEISQSEMGSVVILTLSGPLVTGQQEALTEKVDACLAGGACKIILDMKKVPFIDSVGLEALESLVPELARSGAELRLTGLNDICRDILEVTRLNRFFYIIEDTESALRSLS